MIEKKIYRTAHIYITAFRVDFVTRKCHVRRECRHIVEGRQCAERCATEIKVGHLKDNSFGQVHRKNPVVHGLLKGKFLLVQPQKALAQDVGL